GLGGAEAGVFADPRIGAVAAAGGCSVGDLTAVGRLRAGRRLGTAAPVFTGTAALPWPGRPGLAGAAPGAGAAAGAGAGAAVLPALVGGGGPLAPEKPTGTLVSPSPASASRATGNFHSAP